MRLIVARCEVNYAGNVTLIEDQISDILRVVEERGELDRTVVASVSDHGEMNGDHNLIYKQNFLNPAVRVPFIVRLPPPRARRRDWKLAVDRRGEVYMLYDLGADPLEARNLAGLPQYEEVTKRLLRFLRRSVGQGRPARSERSPWKRAKRGFRRRLGGLRSGAPP